MISLFLLFFPPMFVHGAVNVYTPDPNVQAAHRIPHLGGGSNYLSPGSSDFPSSGKSITVQLQSYFTSIAVVPAIFLVIGILSVILIQLIMCCRWCCKRCMPSCYMRCFKCKRDSVENMGKTETKASFKYTTIAFIFFLTFVLIADLCVFVGLEKFVASFVKFGDALTELSVVFGTISTAGLNMQNDGKTFNAQLSSSACSFIPSEFTNVMQNALSSFSSAAGTIHTMTSPLPIVFDNLKQQIITKWIAQFTNVSYIYMACILFVIFIFVVARVAKSKILLTISFILAELIVITLTAISCIEMVFVTFLADFCMDPASNIVGLLPQGTARDILAYYTQCMAPVGPLDTYINITTVAMKSLNYTVTKSVTSFANASHVSKSTSLQCIGSLVNPIASMNKDIISAINQVKCAPLNHVFRTAVDESLCTLAFDGEYSIWLTHFLTAGSLFFVLLVSTLFFDQFDAFRYNLMVDTQVGPTSTGGIGDVEGKVVVGVQYEPGVEMGQAHIFPGDGAAAGSPRGENPSREVSVPIAQHGDGPALL